MLAKCQTNYFFQVYMISRDAFGSIFSISVALRRDENKREANRRSEPGIRLLDKIDILFHSLNISENCLHKNTNYCLNILDSVWSDVLLGKLRAHECGGLEGMEGLAHHRSDQHLIQSDKCNSDIDKQQISNISLNSIPFYCSPSLESTLT